MKEFRIYESTTGDIKAMDNGFSWSACLFSSFWALYHKLYFVVVISLIVFIAFGIILSMLVFRTSMQEPSIASMMYEEIMRRSGMSEDIIEGIRWRSMIRKKIAYVIMGLIGVEALIKRFFGLCGNSWLENNLIKKGYIFKGSLNASDSTEAISLYEQSKKGEEARRRKIEQEREIGQIVRIEGISETEKTSEE